MPRPRSDIRPRIVEAARTQFLAHGVDGASLREIARDAGTSLGMIVYYFPSKDDLFLAVVEDVYAGIVRDLEAIISLAEPTHVRLKRGLIRIGMMSDLELDVVHVLAREGISSSSRLRQIIGRFMRGHVPLVTGLIEAGVRDGEFDASVPVPVIFLAIIGLGGLPQLVRRGLGGVAELPGLPDADALATLSIELLSRAVGTRGTPRG